MLNCKALIQGLKDFDPGFGRVWDASGFRVRQALTIEGGRHQKPTNCDWALIEVLDERLSSNTVSLAIESITMYAESNCSLDCSSACTEEITCTQQPGQRKALPMGPEIGVLRGGLLLHSGRCCQARND